MTRMRNLVLGSLAALAIGGAASSASAMETGTFQNRLNGATIGLPLGALPPPGLYTGLETAYLGIPALVVRGRVRERVRFQVARCLFLPAIAQAVPLLWVPGWNFLGASYGMSVVEAFYTCQQLRHGAVQLGNGPESIVGPASYLPTRHGTRSLCRGTWAAAGSRQLGFNFMAPIGTHTTADNQSRLLDLRADVRGRLSGQQLELGGELLL